MSADPKGCDKFNLNLWNNFKESIDTYYNRQINHTWLSVSNFSYSPIQQTVFIFTTLGTNERWLFYPHAR